MGYGLLQKYVILFSKIRRNSQMCYKVVIFDQFPKRVIRWLWRRENLPWYHWFTKQIVIHLSSRVWSKITYFQSTGRVKLDSVGQKCRIFLEPRNQRCKTVLLCELVIPGEVFTPSKSSYHAFWKMIENHDFENTHLSNSTYLWN